MRRTIVLAAARLVLPVGLGAVVLGLVAGYARVDGLLNCYLLLVAVLVYPVITLNPRQRRRPTPVAVRRQALDVGLPEPGPALAQRGGHRRDQRGLAFVNPPLVASPYRGLDVQGAVAGHLNGAAHEPAPAVAPALDGSGDRWLSGRRREWVIPARHPLVPPA